MAGSGPASTVLRISAMSASCCSLTAAFEFRPRKRVLSASRSHSARAAFSGHCGEKEEGEQEFVKLRKEEEGWREEDRGMG